MKCPFGKAMDSRCRPPLRGGTFPIPCPLPHNGAAVWRRIVGAINELLADAPAGDASVH